MKTVKYTTSSQYHIASVQIDTLSIEEILSALNTITLRFKNDRYTIIKIVDFVLDGYTSKRVMEAFKVNDEDQLLLFAYDGEFKNCVGLALCFNKKFYSLSLSEGKRSESELYNIFKSKNDKWE